MASPKDIFISYAHTDKEYASQVYNYLNSNGYSCWMDEFELVGGHEWQKEIETALRNCKTVILVISPAYEASESCSKEVSLSCVLKKKVVPVLLQALPGGWPPKGMAFELTKIQYVDLSVSVSSNLPNLLKAIEHTTIESSNNEVETLKTISEATAMQKNIHFLPKQGELRLKIVLRGDSSAGKTCISKRYISDIFSDIEGTTIGACFATKNLELDSGNLHLQIWDTAGQERFRSSANLYAKSCNCLIIMYDITQKSSLSTALTHYEDVKNSLATFSVIVLLGNKIDLTKDRQVSMQEGKNMAGSIGADLFAEVSAKTGENINDVMKAIAILAAVRATNINTTTVVKRKKCLIL